VELLRALAPERARAIGAAARQAVLDRHTYAHRARQVEAVLGEHRAATLDAAE
jgi:hypothetical protein